MVWVRSEYAEELAVLLAWLSALVPWNVSYATLPDLGSLLFVRFPLFQVRYNFGVPLVKAVVVKHPIAAVRFQAGQSLAVPYRVWAAGAGVVAVALVLSFAMYRFEDRVASWPFDPVRAMGALLALAALVLSAATWLLWTRGFPGVKVPAGVVLLFVFGGVLLTVERR